MATPTAAAYRAATRNNGARSAPRRVRAQQVGEGTVPYRIKRGQSVLMLGVALLLDFLPLLTLVALLALFFAAGGAAGGAASSITGWVCRNAGLAADAYFTVGNAGAYAVNSIQMLFGGSATWQTNVGCTEASSVAGAVTAGAVMAAGGAASWWMIGLMYAFVGLFATIVSVLTFPIWFLYLRYNMLSFLHTKRVLTNITSFACTGLFKHAPLLNLFPFPIYTITVWRHIHLARTEDTHLHNKLQASKRAGRNAVEEGLWEA